MIQFSEDQAAAYDAVAELLARAGVDLAEEAVGRGMSPERISAMPILRKLQRLGEEYGEDRFDELSALARDMEEAFHTLEAEETSDAS